MLPLIWFLTTFFYCYANSAETNKFEQLSSKPYFIDKSLLLEVFLSPQTPAYLYISNPRRFGKTINLSMIEKFFKIQVDKDGLPMPYNSTDANRIFGRLKIRQHRDTLFATHMAHYPVLSFSLLKVAERTHKHTVSSLNAELSEAIDNILWAKFLKRFYQFHRELFSSTSERDLKFLGKLRLKKLNRHEIENSLFVLCRILYHYFDKTPVIVLIDDYDQAALNSYSHQNANFTLAYDLINTMIVRVLNQGPKYVRNIVLSGVTSLPYRHRDLLPSKVSHFRFLDNHAFAPFYGFSRSELFELFDRYRCDWPERKDIRKYYKAYQTSGQKAELVYNTYSVTRYFIGRENDKNRLQKPQEALISYWRQSEIQDHRLPLINSRTFRHIIKELLINRTLRHPLSKVYPKDALVQLHNLRASRYKTFSRRSTYLFLTIYFELGYLSHGPVIGTYVVPNIEVRQMLKQQVRHYYQQSKLTSTSKTVALLPNTANGNDEEEGDDKHNEYDDDRDDEEGDDDETNETYEGNIEDYNQSDS